MTALRECFVLPGLLLTVTLLGGVRIGADLRFVPPPLIAVVLGLLLLSALSRAGVLIAPLILSERRTAMENVSGLVVLVSLFAACMQVFNLITPDSGLLHGIFGTFFLVQLLTTSASVRSRADMLRNLGVLFGAAFLLRFIVLESLYAPEGGALKRVVTALLQGGTLGTLTYEPNAPATGYIAFVALLLFFIALFLLPQAGVEGGLLPASSRPHLPVTLPLVVLAAVTFGGCTDRTMPAQTASRATATTGSDEAGSTPLTAAVAREAALRSARVWRAPATPISQARLDQNPAGPLLLRGGSEVPCRFVVEDVGGTTPKFRCELPDGEVVKVKYGRTNPELYAEVATTRLLTALGFGADRMYLVGRVRCSGCPSFPFLALRCLRRTGLRSVCFPGGIDHSRSVEFAPAVIERRIEGRTIEAAADQGWAWYELDAIEPADGGSAAAEVDALRLMAVVLAHWDNKASNQRLVCLPGGDRPDGSCVTPFAILQDVGATFGPLKVDLRGWRGTPVWKDARACGIDMERLPWGGGTFPERRVSEAGRLFLLRLLEQLSASQLEALFTSAGFTTLDGGDPEARRVDAWVDAFRDKVRQLREGGPCPAAPAVRTADAR